MWISLITQKIDCVLWPRLNGLVLLEWIVLVSGAESDGSHIQRVCLHHERYTYAGQPCLKSEQRLYAKSCIKSIVHVFTTSATHMQDSHV
jgi:hypothetical protein